MYVGGEAEKDDDEREKAEQKIAEVGLRGGNGTENERERNEMVCGGEGERRQDAERGKKACEEKEKITADEGEEKKVGGLQKWATEKGMEQRTRLKGMRWAVGDGVERGRREKGEGRRAVKKKRRKPQQKWARAKGRERSTRRGRERERLLEKGKEQETEKKEGGGPEGRGWRDDGAKKDKKEGTGGSGKVKYIDRTYLSYSP